ncbi:MULTISPECIES: hypothetical protein [unclassified Nocardia]|uniref:hypothetical protein n=1 Tax=Nocardia sp. NPDC019255 TaxID=3154591 RepID=UPI00340AE0B4
MVDPPELGRIVLRAGPVWAMTMPTRLGQAVKAHMQSRGVPPGPIVGHPRSGRWTFLIQPDLPDDVRLVAELFRLDVAVARSGARPVSSPANAGKALEMHCDCDYSACATLVAAVIVSREDYRYFRRIEITGDLEMPTLGSGARCAAIPAPIPRTTST